MEIAEEDYNYLETMFPKGYLGKVHEFLDPRDASLKRGEFNKIRNQVYADLKEADGDWQRLPKADASVRATMGTRGLSLAVCNVWSRLSNTKEG